MSETLLDRIEAERADQDRRQAQALEGFAHWRLAQDDAGLAWLLFDQAEREVNTLSDATLGELDLLLKRFRAEPPKALVLASAKAAGFCAGGDIEAFNAIRDPTELALQLERGHAVLARLGRLSVPTIAVLHGHCLGGGLELALACDQRVGLIGLETWLKTGFPEVRIGVHPGLGGTWRAMHTLDPLQALEMMLTGRSVHGHKNRRIGLVAELVEPRHLQAAVVAVAEGRRRAHQSRLAHGKRRLLAQAPVRRLAAAWMRRQTQRKAPPEHYPAPTALIDIWQQHGGDPHALQTAEIESFGRLLRGETAQNLIRVFLLRQRMKGLGAAASGVRQVHVIGAGEMGADIAGWCAIQGLRTTLSDKDPAALGRAVRGAERLATRAHQDRRQQRETLDRLVPDPDNLGIAQADLIIEAVPESVEIKQQVYAEVAARIRDDAMLVTNTSSIPLETLREQVPDRGRFAGLHFFNPVDRMQVVEVVRHDQTDAEHFAALQAFCREIGELPAPVRSEPGFLVNRALIPYLLEALVLMEEGLAPEAIDQAAVEFGMPMGPIELADQVGLDIGLDVGKMLIAALDKPMAELPDWFVQKVDAGEVGKKAGKGFYRWKGGKPQKATKQAQRQQAPSEETADRLLLPLLDVCVACLREGVIEGADLLDATLIFATGFAPFRGGPLQYARARGADALVGRLKALAERHGEHFQPDPGWSALQTDDVSRR